MRNQDEAGSVVQGFCRTWFVERDAAAAMVYLAKNVRFVGTGAGEFAHSREEMHTYILRDIEEIPEPFFCELSLLDEQQITEDVSSLVFELTLTNSTYTWHLRGYFIMHREADGRWLIQDIHVAEPSGKQKPDEHYPQTLVMENVARQRQELLNDSLAGGMMGGYMEDGFPFYFINRQMLDYLGYQNEAEFVKDIEGKISYCMHPDDRNYVDREVADQLDKAGEYVVEYRMKKKDGSYIWVHDVGRKITAENGKPAIASVCIDITEARLLQERVKELYEKELSYFADLVSSEGSIQGRINVTQNRVESYLATSDVALAHVGDSYDQIMENLAESAVDSRYGQELRQTVLREKMLNDYAQGKTEYNFDFLRRRTDGSGIFWGNTSLRSCQNPETGDIIVFFYTFDVTEQRLQEKLLKRVTELDYDMITEIDIDKDSYRLIAFNEAEEGWLPLRGRFQETIRETAMCIIEENERKAYLDQLAYPYMKQELSRQDTYTFLTEIRAKTGEVRVKRLQVFYIDKALGRACVTRTDVTDVVRQEQHQKDELAFALAAAKQASAAKSDFLSRMSHEIRTPMNAIIGMSAVAAQNIGDDEKTAECISKIDISSRFLLSLINDILDMSRIESGRVLLKSEKIVTAEFIEGISILCRAQADAGQVRYECILDPELQECYMGDAMKLQQVLINILSNAIKFTGSGGKVTFSVSARGCLRDNAVLRFVVKDTGIGMDQAFMPHLFEPFSQESTGTTAKYGGTGLGLAIAKSLVDMMDGHISVKSQKGVGTEFTVDVKLGMAGTWGQADDTGDRIVMQTRQPVDADFSGRRVLLVEDNDINTEVARMILENRGIVVETAGNGLQALELFERSEAGYYDLILMDIRMPLMDGLTAASRIRKLDRADAGTVPIIAMTANAFDDDKEKSRAAGMNAHLAKPIEPEILFRTIAKYIL